MPGGGIAADPGGIGGEDVCAGNGVEAEADRERWRLPHAGAATLVELFASSARDSGWIGFLRGMVPIGKPLLWVQERMAILEGGRVYPPGMGAFPDFIHVETRDARDALWAMEEGLRCSALGAVVGETWGDPAALDFTATRRLAVAAERYGVAACLIRLGGHANLSGARWRWRVASAPSLPHPLNPRAPGPATWAVELFRGRGAPPGAWVVTNDGAAGNEGGFDLVAPAGDRAVGQGVRRQAG